MSEGKDERWRDVVPTSNSARRQEAEALWRELRQQNDYARALIGDAPYALERGQLVGKLGATYNCAQAMGVIVGKLLDMAGVDEFPAGPDIGRKTRP